MIDAPYPLIPLATFVPPAAFVASFLFAASRFKSVERNVLIGAAVVLGMVLFFGGAALFVLFAGDRFPTLEVRNQTSHTVVVNVGRGSSRIAPGDHITLNGAYSIRDLDVVSDTTSAMKVHLHLKNEFDPRGDLVVLTDDEAPR